MKRRKTPQQELVLNAVQRMRRHVTAQEVYDAVHQVDPKVSRGTVYRNLNTLAEEGKLRRVEIPNDADRFDFTLKRHYHIRCVMCGSVSDADTAEVDRLDQLVKDDHGFRLLDYDILIKGICPECLLKEEKKEE